MTDRTKVDTSSSMTICCDNCLNGDPWYDFDGTCANCENCTGKYFYFQGLKRDKRCKCGYRVILSAESKLKNRNTTAKELLERIDGEKRMKGQTPMFCGLSLESVYK